MFRPLLPILLVSLTATVPFAQAQSRLSKPPIAIGGTTAPLTALTPTGPVGPAGPAPSGLLIDGTPAKSGLVWSGVPGATGYRVYRATTAPATRRGMVQSSAAPSFSLLTPNPVGPGRYEDLSGLDYRSGYIYRVTAVFPGGEGAPIERAFQPPTPMNPVSVTAVQKGTSVTVTWSPVPGVSKYVVLGQSDTDMREVPPNQNTVTYTGVAPGPHSWAVAGYYLPGPVSTPGTQFPSAALNVTPAVDVLSTGASHSGTRMNIVVAPVKGATTYKLARSYSPNGPFMDITGQDLWVGLNMPYSPHQCCYVSEEKAYKAGAGLDVWYQVTPMSGASPMFSSQPIPVKLPTWFKGPLRVDVAKTGNDQWTVGWEAFPEAIAYEVKLSVNSLITLYSNSNIQPGTSQVNVSGLQPGTKYLVDVVGIVRYQGQPRVEARRGFTLYSAP